MIISQTPFRISFLGGGTDFPAHYQEHSGAVLLTTINQSAYLSVHRLSPFFPHKFRASYARTESVQTPGEFQHPLIRECLLHLQVRDPLEMAHVSDLPGRTGLGTSSAFTVGLLHALHALQGNTVQAATLAHEAISVERERVGDSGGHQDQYAAAYGGFLRIDFSGNQQARVQPVTLSAERRNHLAAHLLLFYLGHERSAESIMRTQQQRTARNVSVLREMKSLVDEAQAVLLSNRALDDFGALLHTSWMLKKSLAPGISNADIDNAYDSACRAGAVGGKILGAGGRGFMLLYAAPEHHGAIATALDPLAAVPFRFSDQGSRIIFNNTE